MEENKSKNGAGVAVLLIIGVLVIALLCAIVYMLQSNNNNEQTINALKSEIANLKNEIAKKNENQYEKIKGKYYATKKMYYDSADAEISCYNSLYLKEDGTFDYNVVFDNHSGFCGNYIINGSEIILNKLFSYGSDVGLTVVSGQVKLKINENGTISDLNKYEESPLSNVVLTKETTEVEQTETLKAYINNAIKYNAIYGEN